MPFKRLCLPAIVVILFFGDASARIPEGNAGPGLHVPALVNKFYTANHELFWLSNSSEASLAKESFVHILDHIRLLGLNKEKYHYAELAAQAVLTDTNELKRQDRLFTDAAISLCKDVFQGGDITGHISSDEVSGRNETTDNNYLLTRLGLIKSAAGLSGLISSLEPVSAEYNILKSELAKQISDGNTKKEELVAQSLNFYRWMHHFHFEKFIVVNIPEARLRFYQQDSMYLQMKVVVGKPATKTPRFSTYCFEVVLYPYWNVPTSIVYKELLPKFRRNPAAIDAMNMQVVTKNGRVVNHYALNWSSFGSGNFPYSLRQCTGCDNSLGVIKFNLSDPFSVYLHDTNFKRAFFSDSRFLSHGCIRVEKPIELGNYLLNNKLNVGFVKACIANQKPVVNKIEKPVPVFVVYLPAAVDSAGSVVYKKDIYRLFN